MTVDRLFRSWHRWTRFCQFLFTPLSDASGASTWMGALSASALFAVSIPVVALSPLAGHLLHASQLLGILILAARYGWVGSWGGFVLTTAGYLAAFSTTMLDPARVVDAAPGLPLVLGIGVIMALACGWFGELAIEQRRLMGQVAHAEERLGSLIDAMPSGMLLLERSGRIIFSNATARRLLNTDAPEEFGISLRALVAEEGWPQIRDRMLDPRTGETLRVTVPGETILRTEWTFARIRDEGEARVLAFFWDAEEKLRREEEAGALTAALRGLQEGVILANLDGTIRYANPAAAQIHGYADRREIIGRTLREHVAERDLGGYEERMKRAQTAGGECEVRLRRIDGGETEVHVTTSPVKNDGALIGTVAVVRDLTEAKVLARRATAADKQATLGRLVAGAAHEINNPLTAILTSAELLRAQPELSAETLSRLEVIQAECARAGRIVRDLLAFARQRPVARVAVELAEVVRTAVALREGYTRTAGIELTLHTPSAAPVQVDVDQIKQVVLNLLVNAEDAVAGMATKRIGVTIGRRGGRALLLVNDSGQGVPEAIQQQIFEPFFTTKPEGHGTGLGLAVSSGIVTEHGGRISVSRGLLGGAQFAVELPLAEGVAQPATVASVAPCTRAGGRLKILAVDDEPAILNAVGRILQRLGHQVHTAATGGDALGLALVERYDVVLSDLRMPGMSGRELHQRLTEEGVLPGTDFIVATGDIADPEAFAFLQATGLPVLLKPFEIRNLVEMLGRCRSSGPEVGPTLDRAG